MRIFNKIKDTILSRKYGIEAKQADIQPAQTGKIRRYRCDAIVEQRPDGVYYTIKPEEIERILFEDSVATLPEPERLAAIKDFRAEQRERALQDAIDLAEYRAERQRALEQRDREVAVVVERAELAEQLASQVAALQDDPATASETLASNADPSERAELLQQLLQGVEPRYRDQVVRIFEAYPELLDVALSRDKILRLCADENGQLRYRGWQRVPHVSRTAS